MLPRCTVRRLSSTSPLHDSMLKDVAISIHCGRQTKRACRRHPIAIIWVAGSTKCAHIVGHQTRESSSEEECTGVSKQGAWRTVDISATLLIPRAEAIRPPMLVLCLQVQIKRCTQSYAPCTSSTLPSSLQSCYLPFHLVLPICYSRLASGARIRL